jgi:hypothetical protein
MTAVSQLAISANIERVTASAAKKFVKVKNDILDRITDLAKGFVKAVKNGLIDMARLPLVILGKVASHFEPPQNFIEKMIYTVLFGAI